MRYQPPRRLHWVQVRDSVVRADQWRRGRLIRVDSDGAHVESDDGETATLQCQRLDGLHALSTKRGLPHERGGRVVLWTVRDRMLALPLADQCEDGARVVVTPSVVILEEGHEVDLLAGDSTWRARLFEARDMVALRAAAKAKAAAEAAKAAAAERRPDRSTLHPLLRSSLLPPTRSISRR